MSNYISNFKSTDYNKRLGESQRVADKHPDRCSIIVGKINGSDVPEIDKHKFLVPRDLTVGQFAHVIRKRIKHPVEKAMFLFVNKIMPVPSWTIGNLYDKHKDRDQFLYISYANENTFG